MTIRAKRRGRYKGMRFSDIISDLVGDFYSPADFIKFNFSVADKWAPASEMKSEGAMRVEPTVERVLESMDVMESHGWDPDEEKHRAQRSQARFKHKKWRHDQTVKGVVPVPARVLSNLIGLHDFWAVSTPWDLKGIRREVDGSPRGDGDLAATPPLEGKVRVPAPLVIHLVDVFNHVADGVTRHAIERDAITVDNLKRLERAVTRQLDTIQGSLGKHIHPGVRLIKTFDEFVDVYGGDQAHVAGLSARAEPARSLEDQVMRGLADAVAKDVDRELLRDIDLSSVVPEFMTALKGVAEVRAKDNGEGWEATVASHDASNWRFQVGSFVWKPKMVQIDFRRGRARVHDKVKATDKIAVRVILAERVATPDVGKMLERALMEDRTVCAQLNRHGGVGTQWFWGAEAGIEKLRTAARGVELTVVTDVAYISHGSYEECLEASRQFRKEMGVDSTKLGGPLPAF